ncbi:hypothetical protein D7D52_28340 [Nocardia yunnanensis]|uniref:Uncharacterized protein n=1 Tax=Nocardia yunnanensis TaxID=2382165 RepID=A0A386ZQ05_9NOCA|nr:hypothetical protein D7D52_28340 [Nocardia yunnanensis]
MVEPAREVTHRIARELATAAPEGWERVDATFAWTVTDKTWNVVYSAGEQAVRVEPTQSVLLMVQEQRELAARMSEGPWWRMRISLNNTGQVQTDYDYGDEPFPDDQLFPAEAYLADLREYPRERLPIWLAAYVSHGGRLLRPPRVAAEQARTDRANEVRGHATTEVFPPLPLMWSHWTTLAAVFVALDAPNGPRMLPALGWFEGPNRSGSTLYVLPGDRAVISGGVLNAPELDAVYNDGALLPRLYAGAPDWVTDAVLNPRAATGQLTFCYWWEDGQWFRGESPDGSGVAAAVPGIWTTGSTVDEILQAMTAAGKSITDATKSAVATLVSAAQAGVVTYETVAAVFDPAEHDVDSALNQFTLAGLRTFVIEPPLSRIDAIEQVRRFISTRGTDTSEYPLDQLTAERIDNGWMVFVPTRPGEIMIGRAIYYIADDGVIEPSSSSVPPNVYIAGFIQRFHERARERG